MFIYLIVNHVTGKYYVGQHKGNNLKKYFQTKFSDAKHQRSGSSHLFNSMRKHLDQKYWSIHALLSDVQTREELDQHEREFISFLRSTDSEYGYNICRGGEGRTGPASEESKQKASATHKKRFEADPSLREKVSQQTRERMQDPQYRDKVMKNLNREGMSNISDKTRENLSRDRKVRRSDKQRDQWRTLRTAQKGAAHPMFGLHHSAETKAKISTTKKGTPAPNFIDLSGKTLNGIAVLGRKPSDAIEARWTCRCHCGQNFIASGYKLRKGLTRSCGCLRIKN